MTMNKNNFTLSAWQRLSKWVGGKWIFSKLVCIKAPYFSTIQPKFIALLPGYCEVQIKKRRGVLNHIGTVHAIAMCNMAELAGGIMTDVSIPLTHRWIPKGMTVEYLGKAKTNLRAIAELTPIPSFEGSTDLPVTVKIFDANDKLIFRAVITILVSPKK
jgi:acyl-coenzyme A thioesterase PaaI-like protein